MYSFAVSALALAFLGSADGFALAGGGAAAPRAAPTAAAGGASLGAHQRPAQGLRWHPVRAAPGRGGRSSSALAMNFADRPTGAAARKAIDAAAAAVTVETVATAEELSALLEANPQKLVVVKWYATWCRSCRAMDVKFRRVAGEHPDVVFAQIDIAEPEAKELGRELGIKSIPFVHFYAGSAGLREAFACGVSKVPELASRVAIYEEFCAAAATAAAAGAEPAEAAAVQLPDAIDFPPLGH